MKFHHTPDIIPRGSQVIIFSPLFVYERVLSKIYGQIIVIDTNGQPWKPFLEPGVTFHHCVLTPFYSLHPLGTIKMGTLLLEVHWDPKLGFDSFLIFPIFFLTNQK